MESDGNLFHLHSMRPADDSRVETIQLTDTAVLGVLRKSELFEIQGFRIQETDSSTRATTAISRGILHLFDIHDRTSEIRTSSVCTKRPELRMTERSYTCWPIPLIQVHNVPRVVT